MQEVDASNHGKVRAEIVALVVNKRLLLVETPADNHQLQFLCGDENYVAKRWETRFFPHCHGLRAPHNQMRLRGLDIHSRKGTRGVAFGPSQDPH
jgi:hypothetical protein